MYVNISQFGQIVEIWLIKDDAFINREKACFTEKVHPVASVSTTYSSSCTQPKLMYLSWQFQLPYSELVFLFAIRCLDGNNVGPDWWKIEGLPLVSLCLFVHDLSVAEHIVTALPKCGNPASSIKRVKKQVKHKANKEKKTQRKHPSSTKCKCVGTTKARKHFLKWHSIASAERPHMSHRNLLVHPNDKIPKENCCSVIYEDPCKNCEKTYIGETLCQLGTCKTQHQKEVEKVGLDCYTRTQKKNHLKKNPKKP